jgi:hypothetical protein
MKSKPVTLRIRIVKVTAGFDRIQTGVFTICGGTHFNLSVKDPEWAVFHMRSEKEEIIFRTPYGNASCLCRDLDGRKRIDLSEDFSILIEAYWAMDAFGVKSVKQEIPLVKEVTDDCEISFMATRESATNRPLAAREDSSSSEEDLWASPKLKKSARPHGPVEIALAWMQEPVSLFETNASAAATENRSRVVYEPFKKGEKFVWEPELTAMTANKESSRGGGLEPLIKSVCMSQNLDRIYF